MCFVVLLVKDRKYRQQKWQKMTCNAAVLEDAYCFEIELLQIYK